MIATAAAFDPNWVIAMILLLTGLISGAVVALRGGGGTAVAGLQATQPRARAAGAHARRVSGRCPSPHPPDAYPKSSL